MPVTDIRDTQLALAQSSAGSTSLRITKPPEVRFSLVDAPGKLVKLTFEFEVRADLIGPAIIPDTLPYCSVFEFDENVFEGNDPGLFKITTSLSGENAAVHVSSSPFILRARKGNFGGNVVHPKKKGKGKDQ